MTTHHTNTTGNFHTKNLVCHVCTVGSNYHFCLQKLSLCIKYRVLAALKIYELQFIHVCNSAQLFYQLILIQQISSGSRRLNAAC